MRATRSIWKRARQRVMFRRFQPPARARPYPGMALAIIARAFEAEPCTLGASALELASRFLRLPRMSDLRQLTRTGRRGIAALSCALSRVQFATELPVLVLECTTVAANDRPDERLAGRGASGTGFRSYTLPGERRARGGHARRPSFRRPHGRQSAITRKFQDPNGNPTP